MRRFIALSWFHFKLFMQNSYFIMLTCTSTISLFLLQYVYAYASGYLNDPNLWIRAGIFGMWCSSTTAAGAIGFQRHQGVLPYLMNNAVSDKESLAAVILPSVSFGLLAFPLSWLLSHMFSLETVILSTSSSSYMLFFSLHILLLWFGAIAVCFVVASFFVLTRNAIVYEQIITMPLLLLSGLFMTHSESNLFVKIPAWFIPIVSPIHLLLSTEPVSSKPYLQFFVSFFLWMFFANRLSGFILKKARTTGELGVIG